MQSEAYKSNAAMPHRQLYTLSTKCNVSRSLWQPDRQISCHKGSGTTPATLDTSAERIYNSNAAMPHRHHTHTHPRFKFNDVRKEIKQSACQTSATKASTQHQRCWKLLHNQAMKATLRCHKGNAHTRDPHVMMPEVCRNQPAKLPAT